MKTVIDYTPYPGDSPGREDDVWPCSWVQGGKTQQAPLVLAFCKRISVDKRCTVRCHVSADERYELYLNGEWIGRGPERGDAAHWFFDTYDLVLPGGMHTLVAKVWALGEMAPLAQMSVAPGRFLLSPEDPAFMPLLGTGTSEWTVRELKGFTFERIPYAFGIGWRERIDGNVYGAGDYRSGGGAGWDPAVAVSPARSGTLLPEGEANLVPSMIPPMMNRAIDVPVLVESRDLPSDAFETASSIPLCTENESEERGGWAPPTKKEPICIPANTVRRMVIQLDDYYCVYPEIRLAGGRHSRVRIGFSEAAYLEKNPEKHEHYRYEKGARDRIGGKYFLCSIGSTFYCSGEEHALFDPLWWFSGRYIEVLVETDAEPLRIEEIRLYETRYPLEMDSQLRLADPDLARVASMCLRTLQMCSHETYMDCPFYEQLMYVGDTRLEALATYAITRDDALPRKAIRMFNASRRPDGLTQACYPYRDQHTIAPFSLWWIAMIYDYALWRSPEILTEEILDHMRAIVSFFMGRKNRQGLVVPGTNREPGNFNFIDWVEAWQNGYGVPPGEGELNSVVNWQWVYTLKMYARLEKQYGCPHRARQAQDEIRKVTTLLIRLFWSEEKGLFADNPQQTHFSEHAQCMAILSGTLPSGHIRMLADRLGRDSSMAETTLYFAHYYLEACTRLGRMDLFENKIQTWRLLPAQGFATIPETPEPTRSDCHAWGAHPLFHQFASVLGIRPASFGFETVEIRPQPGRLHQVAGKMVYPRGGAIEVEITRRGERVSGRVVLPAGLRGGGLILPGKTLSLRPGTTRFEATYPEVKTEMEEKDGERGQTSFCDGTSFHGGHHDSKFHAGENVTGVC